MTSARTIPHFYASILFQARQNPGATAVVFGGTRVSYGAFVQHIDNVTRHLQGHDLAAGTRVLIDIPHSYLHWLVAVAASRLGLVGASADPTSDRVAMLDLLGTRVIVADRADGQPQDAMVLVAGQAWLDAAPEGLQAPVPERIAADGPARITFSSGTTGVPKKIAMTHGQLDERVKLQAFDVGAQSRFLSAVSLSTIGGFMYPIRTWGLGGTVVFRLEGEVLHDTIVGAGLTHLFLSPAQLADLVNGLPSVFLPVPGLTVIVGGGAIPQAFNRLARLRLSSALYQIYGSTEAGTVAYSHAALADGNPTLAGHVVPAVEVEAVGADGMPVAPGTPGELRIRSPWCVDGYVDGDDGATFREGWFYPGDIAILGAGRVLHIVGRSSELMNLGGQKIAPLRIEEALTPHPGVTDIAAFALPDEQGIERPWVAVVVTAGFDQQALITQLRDRYPELPPLSVAMVPDIARNTMGKVLRKELRERVAAALARRG
jgi:acyl-CoA synthetase (AMP-forming)/AMP-acid ligase II